jgi:hypothetical protein
MKKVVTNDWDSVKRGASDIKKTASSLKKPESFSSSGKKDKHFATVFRKPGPMYVQ